MPSLSAGTSGRAYWRSLDELAETAEFREFVEKEFPNFAPELLQSPARRQFLKMMGASLALAGLAGCRWPKETIVPYADRPRGRKPGVPVQYATAMELGGVATGLLVTSYDGRPIKIEGNEQHPLSRGKTNAIQQASVLELYDPDRSKWPVRRNERGAENVTWEDFVAFAGPHFAKLRNTGGAGLCILSEPSASPSLLDMKTRLMAAFPQAEWCEYEPLSRDSEREGARLALGAPYRAHLHLERADVIVSLDADFLMDHPAAVKCAGDFAARRRADDGTMNRLYVVESDYSVTGTMADHRYALRCEDLLIVAARLVREAVKQGLTHPAMTGELLALLEPAEQAALDTAFVEGMARDLLSHRGRSLIVAGARAPADVQALAHLLNAALGNAGRTVTYTAESAKESGHAALARLNRLVSAGKVDTLVILGGNPAVTGPRSLKADPESIFAKSLDAVGTTIHLSLYEDETSRRCNWHLPQAHYLESWGDGRAYDGTVSIVQPLIEPLYERKTPAELLALLIGDDATSGYDITRRTFRGQFASSDVEQAWRLALHAGVVESTAWPAQTPSPQPGGELAQRLEARVSAWQPTAAGAFEVVFRPDYSVYDGRFANNGWLQELPDPITKLTWDNAALMSPADAESLGVTKYGDVIRIEMGEVAGNMIEIPAYPLPGHARGCVTLPLGYGRTAAGRVAEGAGVDVYPLFHVGYESHLRRAIVSNAGRHRALATTQDHHAIRSEIGDKEQERRVEEELVREATLPEYLHNRKFARHEHHTLPLWQEKKYDQGHQWGMAIDLSACIGCNACVAACQAENNIPVVGREEVAKGREMHWIRVDRYFKGEPESPRVEVVHQPVTCHHCENAPCEQVCPVAATVHDQEGLNVMVYNRCVGTRYCNNNCPFKVRRFNWFYNHHGPEHPRAGAELTEIEKLVHNPDVTVRSRGVMEKCSFCVQRISAAKITAKNEGWDGIPDDAFTSACAQACPTDAIVFGDLNDPNSRVRKLHDHDRSYELLGVLHLKSRLHYLAKLRNPAGAAPPADEHGHTDHSG